MSTVIYSLNYLSSYLWAVKLPPTITICLSFNVVKDMIKPLLNIKLKINLCCFYYSLKYDYQLLLYILGLLEVYIENRPEFWTSFHNLI